MKNQAHNHEDSVKKMKRKEKTQQSLLEKVVMDHNKLPFEGEETGIILREKNMNEMCYHYYL